MEYKNDQEEFMERFGMFSKLQDPIMYLGYGNRMAVLSVVLNMMNKTLQGEPKYFYSEVQYFSSYLNCETRKIKRDINVYVTLENVKPIDGLIEYVALKPKDLEFMKFSLIPYLERIFAEDYDQIYYIDAAGHYCIHEYKQLSIKVGQKELIFMPGYVPIYNEPGKYDAGIDMYLNSYGNMISMIWDQVFGLIYFLKTFDIYSYGANMLAFMQRPPEGTNRYNLHNSEVEHSVKDYINEREDQRRFIKKQSQGSYFTKKKT